MKLKRKIVTLEEYSKNKGKYYFETYITAIRKGRGCALDDPFIYKKYGGGNMLTENAIIKLSRTNPKTRVGLHGGDGVTMAIVQARNVRMIVGEEVK